MTTAQNADPVFGQARKFMDGRIESAANGLYDEFLNAFKTDPRTLIATPGFHKPYLPVADVVSNEFAGTSGEYLLDELLSIVASAMKHGGDLGERAESLVNKFANLHANFHAEDAA